MSTSQSEDAARRMARTLPAVMGTLSAGMREHGEGLHPAQFRLFLAMHMGAVSPTELAERMQVSMPTISKTIGVLERRGLVERTPDEADRRRVQLTMTDEGRALLRKALDSGIDHLSRLLDSATPEELDRIEQGMECLSDVIARAHPDHEDGHHQRPAREGASKE